MKDALPQRLPSADGTETVVRLMTPEDTERLFAFYRDLPEEDRLYLDEDVTRREVFDRHLDFLRRGIAFAIVAEEAGRIIGHGTLERSRHGWTAHVGEIRVVVAHDRQRSGIGTTLARALVRQGIAWGLDKMIAQVMDKQVGARRAFEKLGFREEAILRKHVRDVSGVTRDLIVLSNDISHLWESMEAMAADYSPAME
jgi:RimJ/RimL family protein N-acetyltransferase